ncbi:Uncharacterised protein [Vibrio cholerae]|nr:Uncharacterised protein [Vibrio cholerae]
MLVCSSLRTLLVKSPTSWFISSPNTSPTSSEVCNTASSSSGMPMLRM